MTYEWHTHQSKELEMLLDGERIEEDVVLWAESQAFAHPAQIVSDVMSVNDGVA